MLSGGARHEVVVGAALLDPLGNGGVCHVAWLLVAAFVARLRLALKGVPEERAADARIQSRACEFVWCKKVCMQAPGSMIAR